MLLSASGKGINKHEHEASSKDCKHRKRRAVSCELSPRFTLQPSPHEGRRSASSVSFSNNLQP